MNVPSCIIKYGKQREETGIEGNSWIRTRVGSIPAASKLSAARRSIQTTILVWKKIITTSDLRGINGPVGSINIILDKCPSSAYKVIHECKDLQVALERLHDRSDPIVSGEELKKSLGFLISSIKNQCIGI
jgi:hypothetical protein